MRTAIGIFGMVAGAIVVALVARYGYVGSDTPLDGVITAFFFAVIAIGGIAGPAVVVRLFKAMRGWARLWAVIACFVVAVALLANLSNSLGAIVGRADKTIAERQKATDARKDDRAELARIIRQREAMPAFVPTDTAAIAAAKRAADTATAIKEAECAKRGSNCRQREVDEQKAATSLADATTAKVATDTAALLDGKAETIRNRLGTAAPVGSVNPLADTLARMFHIGADDAATWQQVATVVVVELLIAFALIVWELLAPPVIRREEPATSAVVPGGNVVTLASGDVGNFATARLQPAPGRVLNIAELHEPYRQWCADTGCRALGLEEFAEQFAQLCDFAGVRKRIGRGGLQCLDLALSA